MQFLSYDIDILGVYDVHSEDNDADKDTKKYFIQTISSLQF